MNPLRATGAAATAAAAVAFGAEGAAAHGIGDGARDRSVLEFVPLGIEHMLLGWDHLLFILGIVLLAGRPGRAAKLITLFVAGHSLTLIVATVSGWQVDATLVDVFIALSVVFVGVQADRGLGGHAQADLLESRPSRPRTLQDRLGRGRRERCRRLSAPILVASLRRPCAT